jgi:exodeoxyribonuclease III
MKLYSWNINSIRARTDRLLQWLSATQPDVLCLQELKCTEEQFPAEEIAAAGYRVVANFQKTYNGVAILSKGEEPTDVVLGLSDGVEDTHARLIAATVRGLRVICAYAPNGQEVDSPAYQYKLEWYRRLRHYLDTRHRSDQALVLTGDFNVAPEDIDVHDPVLWKGQTLFSEPEKAALAGVVSFGFTDTFRRLNPAEQKFSWWDYRMLSFPKNRGLRIDHVLVTPPLVERVAGAGIDREARKGKQPSDHAPIWVELRD